MRPLPSVRDSVLAICLTAVNMQQINRPYSCRAEIWVTLPGCHPVPGTVIRDGLKSHGKSSLPKDLVWSSHGC